ncbi:MAG: hypothetical protein KBT22_12440 [Bacteroidales bacterium]|nr:hypothetical protein [Candidatus Scybalocola fimicaballi]
MKIGYFGKALCATALSATMANAQDINVYKALNQSLEDPTLGSARYAGMGGAMGAIGGVSSALKDNAASIAAGTSSDIGLTFNLYSNNDGQCSFVVSDASLLFNIEHNSSGYVSSALGITYNRNRTYDRDMFLIDKTYSSTTNDHEEGGTDVVNFAYAGNINNQLYFGVAVGITDLRFEKTNIYRDNELHAELISESNGTGCNFNVGLLYQPTDAVRFGIGVQTPTMYYIDEYWEMKENRISSDDDYHYKLHTPMKFSAQAGFMIGDRANIGIDYSMRNYSRMWTEMNNIKMRLIEQDIKEVCKTQHTLKAGAEINIVDGFDVRAGYAVCTAPVLESYEACNKLNNLGGAYSGDYWDSYVNDEGVNIDEFYGPMYSFSSPKMRQYISAGFGYSGKIAYVDFAYIRKIANTEYMLNSPFNEYQCNLVSEYASKQGVIKEGSNHFMLSFGFHF